MSQELPTPFAVSEPFQNFEPRKCWCSLIDGCISGSSSAWGALFDELQPKLIKIVGLVMGTNAKDQNLVDEIAARVWFTLIDRRYQILRQFNPQLGIQLTTYLSGIVRTEWLQYLRGERRRARRELFFAVRQKQENTGTHGVEDRKYPEFRAKLTNREREYWDYLVGDVELPSVQALTPTNVWKLRQRIRKKFVRYLAGASESSGCNQAFLVMPCQETVFTGKQR